MLVSQRNFACLGFWTLDLKISLAEKQTIRYDSDGCEVNTGAERELHSFVCHSGRGEAPGSRRLESKLPASTGSSKDIQSSASKKS